jgi:hypothetical protein
MVDLSQIQNVDACVALELEKFDVAAAAARVDYIEALRGFRDMSLENVRARVLAEKFLLEEKSRLSPEGECVPLRVEKACEAECPRVPSDCVSQEPGSCVQVCVSDVTPHWRGGCVDNVNMSVRDEFLLVSTMKCVECNMIGRKCLCVRLNCSVCLKSCGQCRCCSSCGHLSKSRCSQCHDFSCGRCLLLMEKNSCCVRYSQGLKSVGKLSIGTPLHPLVVGSCHRCAKLLERCVCCDMCCGVGIMKCSACKSVYCSDVCEMSHSGKCEYRNMLPLKVRGRAVKFDDFAVAQVGCAQGGMMSLPQRLGDTADEVKDAVRKTHEAGGYMDRLSSAVIPLNNVLESLNAVLESVRGAISGVVAKVGSIVAWVGDNMALLGIALCALTPIARWGIETVSTVLNMISKSIEFVGDTVVLPGLKLFLRLVEAVRMKSPLTEDEGAFAQVGFSGNCVMAAVMLLTLVKSPEAHVLKAIRYVAPLAVGLGALSTGIEAAMQWLPVNGQKWLIECGFLRPLGELSKDYAAVVVQFMGMFDRVGVEDIANIEIAFKVAFCAARDQVVRSFHVETCGKSTGCAIMIGKMIVDSECFYRSFKAHIRDVPKVQAMSSMLYGPAGSGKSSLAMALSNILCPSVSSYNVAWTRTVGDKYWSGYAGEEAVIFDDISQGTNDVKTEICAELIRLIGPVPFRPIMADVDLKGILAEPKCVIASTNDAPSRIINGINMKAFRRRFLHWWVEPVKAFSKLDGTLDEERVKVMSIGDRISFRHIDIWRVTFDAAGKATVHKEKRYSVADIAGCMRARALVLNDIEALKVADLKALKERVLIRGIQYMVEDEKVPFDPFNQPPLPQPNWGDLQEEDLNDEADENWVNEVKDEVMAQVCFECVANNLQGCLSPGCREDDEKDEDVLATGDVAADVQFDPKVVSFSVNYLPSDILASFFKQVFEMSARFVTLVALSETSTAWNIGMFYVANHVNRLKLFCQSCLVNDSANGLALCADCSLVGGSRTSTWFTRVYRREFDATTSDDRRLVAKQLFRFASPLLRYLDLCNGLGLNVNMSDYALKAGHRFHVLQAHPDKGGTVERMVVVTEIFKELRECRRAIRQMVRNTAFYPFFHSCVQRHFRFPTELDILLWDVKSVLGLTDLRSMVDIVQCRECDGRHLVHTHCFACHWNGAVCDESPQFSVKRLVTLFVDLLPPAVAVRIQQVAPSRFNRVEWLQTTIAALVSIINHDRDDGLVQTVDFVRLAREDPRLMVYRLEQGLLPWCVANNVEYGPVDITIVNILHQTALPTDRVIDELQFITPGDDVAAQCEAYRQRKLKRWTNGLTFENFLEKARAFVSSPLVMDLAKVMAVIGTIAIAYKGARFVVSCFSAENVAQIGSNGEDIVFHRHEKERMVRDRQLIRHRQRRDAIKAVANVGSSESVTATTVVLDRVSNNIASIERSIVGNKPFRLCGLFVHKKMLMLPRHFFLNPDQTQIQEGAPMIIRCGSVTYTVPFQQVALIDGPLKNRLYLDVCFYDCSTDQTMKSKICDFPSLLDKFADEIVTDDLDSFGGFVLMKSTLESEVEWVVLPDVEFEGEPLEYGLTVKGPKPFYIPSQYKYAPQNRGDCGSILIGVSKSLGGHITILGAHNADRTRQRKNYGVAMPIDRRVLASCLVSDGEVAVANMWIEEIDGAYKGGLGPQFKVLARSVNPRLGPANTKTSYVESLIFDDAFVSGVTRAPAILGDPSDPRSELMEIQLVEKELNRAFDGEVEEFPYDRGDVRLISDSLLDALCVHVDPGVLCRRLNLHEALNGGVGTEFSFLKPVCVTTSAGWPWCVMDGVVGKRPLVVGVAGEYAIGDVRLKRRLIEVWNDSQNGRLFSPIVPNKKDELRDIEKIKREELRLVNCMQFEHTLTSRMVFGAFVNFIHSIHTVSASAVGMDVLSEDWSVMVRRWLRVGVSGFDGDIKKFERYLNRQLAEMCCSIVDGWYVRCGGFSVEESKVRRGLVNCMIEGVLIVDNRFVLQPSVLTSGAFGTTAIFGNLMTQFFIRLSWLHLSRQHCPRLIGMDSFDRCVAGSVYGDDNVWVVADSVGEWFNAPNVASVLERVGVVYTPADKKGQHGPNKPFLDLQFLKMRTVRDGRFPGREYLAVPDLPDLLPSLKWVTRSLPGSMALVVNMNAVLRRCFGWERVKWTDFRIELMRALAKVGILETLLTWEALLNCDDLIREIGADDFVFDFQMPRTFAQKLRTVGAIGFLGKVVPLNRVRREYAYAQMDVSAPNEIQNLDAKVVQHVIGLGGNVSVGDESVVTEGTLISMLTRKMFPLKQNVTQVPINRLNAHSLWGSDPFLTFQKMGPLGWWGYPFAWYQGSLDVMWTGPIIPEFSWESHMDTHTSIIGPKPYVDYGRTLSISGVLNCGFGNQMMMDSGPSTFAMANLPSLSRVNFQAYPREHAQFAYQDTSTGLFSLYNAGNSSNMTQLFLWVGGGSDMRFFQPVYLPQIRYFATPWAMEEVVAQMDGVKSDSIESDLVLDRFEHGDVLKSIGERQQTFTSMAEDWQYIQTINWSGSNATGDILLIGRFPRFGVAGFNAWAFEAFQFFRGDMYVRLQVDSPIYQSGRLMMGFFPSIAEADLHLYLLNQASWTWGSHAVLYAGGSREVTLAIPWSFPNNYYDLVSDALITGTFAIWVGDYIRIGSSGPDSAVVTMSVSFRNSQFLVRRVVPSSKGGRKLAKKQPKGDDEKDDFIVAQGGSFSRHTTPADAVMVHNIAVFNSSLMRRHPVDNKMGLTRNEGSHIDGRGPTIGTFVSRPTFSASADWTDTDPAGSVLLTFPLTIAPVSLNIDTILLDFVKSVTSMEYASLPFDQWRCKSLGFRVEVVATRFHSGRLAVVSKFGSDFTDYATIGDAMSQYAQIIDVADLANVHDIIVPWVTPYNWLHCPKRIMANDVYKSQYAYGNLHFIVLNELRAVEAVSPSIVINIYLFAEGVEFRGQTMTMQAMQIESSLFGARKESAVCRNRPLG